MTAFPGASPGIYSKQEKGSSLMLLGGTLFAALALFLTLGWYTEKAYEREEMGIVSSQQHSLTIFLRKALDIRLRSLSAHLGTLAGKQIPQELARASGAAERRDRVAALLDELDKVFPEITAHGLSRRGESPLISVVDLSMSRPAIKTVTLNWLAQPPPDTLSVPPMHVSRTQRIIGMRAPVPLPDGGRGTLVVALDFDRLVARYLHSFERTFPGRMTVFNDTGTILYDDNQELVGTRAFAFEPGQDTPKQAMYRNMLNTPSGSHLCQIPDDKDPEDICRIMSWDSMTVGRRAIVFAISSTERGIAAHRTTAAQRRLLIGGLFAVAMAAIVGLFLRARTQRKLGLRTMLLQTQQEASPDGILVMDENRKPMSWNTPLLSLLHFPFKEDPRTVRAAIPDALARTFADDPDLLTAMLEPHGHAPAEFEGREVHLPDGRTVEIHSRGFSASPGARPGRIWFLRDMTERIAAREALARTTRQLQTIMDNVPSLIYLRAPDGTFILTNRRYEDFFGWKPGHTRGKTPLDLLPPHVAKRIIEADRTVVRTGRPLEYEETIHSIEGERVLLSREAPVFEQDGTITAICGISTDITPRKQMERRLRDTVDEFESIFDNSLVGVLMQRDGRTNVRVNARLAEIFGYEPHEMVNRTSEFMHLSRSHFEEFGDKYYSQLTEGSLFNKEYRFRRKDGETIWCGLSGQALDRTDPDKGVIWILEDITERKHLEALRDDVEQIMRHDLKTPLSTVIHAPELLREDLELDEEQSMLLDELQKAGRRMLDMINRSLDMMKMERGTYRLDPEPLDAVELIRTVAYDLRPLADKQRARVEIRTPQGPVAEDETFLIHGERLLCYSMLGNLIKNALEAAPPDSTVTLTLAAGQERTIAIHNPGAVPKEMRQRFFDKYASTGKSGGTGLGAYSARLMAETHGGCLTMVTGEETGTTVTIHLPVAPGKPTVTC